MGEQDCVVAWHGRQDPALAIPLEALEEEQTFYEVKEGGLDPDPQNLVDLR